ncbi:uncharacterized protein A1O5_07945 [Cladophialophora psammophila CBS 110553]|uniref:Zn(2)-C6 fungal-type domain-containing protein n=1 Tax=Cladophialophora psammophila CBS 110553 TaxID=1182543 RepID=W9WVD3_9EURO|nr:uncharacterized protein A1O5_07945 [Cladophialophora psammophila CBS 110553]EXJ69010.1 hypothetical protein A1O5_07945 [Cladophialophora psammophila CBS 110553]
MSGPYDHGMNMPIPNILDATYPIYDGNFNTAYPRLSGPPTHFDGVAFWYNPTNTEQLYDRQASLLSGRRGAGPPNSMDSSAVKHRRTRSGCFTCRSRRVKCDETRPVCDRCKKGNRECEFPQTTSSSKRTKHGDSRGTKDQAAKHEMKDESMTVLPTIKDESEEDESPLSPTTTRPQPLRSDSGQSVPHSAKAKNASETSSAVKDQTSPQSSEGSDARSRDDTPASSLRTVGNSAEMQARQAKIKSLKPDLQKYLQFQQEYMTFYHYFFKLDPTDFVHAEFIDLALTYEPLLYAAVGFAAYHYELKQPDPKLSHFLGYHSRSLSMLRKSLEKNKKVTEATLLTVLQLATFEEYIGDWVNLVGHHRAALTMVRDLFTPGTMMETDLGRRIFSWIARLDIMVGLMAGNETRLDRQWFEANAAWYHSQVESDPEVDVDIENTMAYFVSSNRLIGMDMAALFAKFAKHEISVQTFHAENAQIVERVNSMKRQIELFNDEYYRVQEFPVEKSRPLAEEDIVNPYVPGGLFKDALYPLNFMWIDWYSIELLQRYQTAVMLQQPMPPELEQISLEQCRIYEAMERWPDAPNGSILGAHAPLGLASVFLKKDARHVMWARRKFAAVERQGYIFPPSFRQKMAELWGLTRDLVGENEAVENWWLPNDEGNIPMLKEIRKVVTERHESDTITSIESIANVRDLKAIFEKLDIWTQSVEKSGVSDGNFSPKSDTSGGLSDRGNNPGFSPTSLSFADTAKGSISGTIQEGGGTLKRRDKRSSSTS